MPIDYRLDFQPFQWDGPLSHIRPDPDSVKRRKEALAKAGGDAWVEHHAQLFREYYPPEKLAVIVTQYLTHYASAALVRNFGTAPQVDFEKSVENYGVAMSEIFRTNDARGEAYPYRNLGERLTASLYTETIYELRQGLGQAGHQLVFGELGTVVESYLATYDGRRFEDLLNRLMCSAVSVLSNGIVRSVSPHLICELGLGFLVGTRHDPAHFIASQSTVATVAGDTKTLKEFTAKTLGLRLEHAKRRVTDNPEDWEPWHEVAEVSLTDKWHEARNPFAKMSNQVRWRLRERKRDDEQDYIDAQDNGIRLEAVDDLAHHVYGKDALVDDPYGALAASSDIRHSVETLPVEDIETAMQRVYRHFQNNPDVLSYLDARRSGIKLKEMPKHLSVLTASTWDKRRVECARKACSRGLQDPVLKDSLVRLCEWAAAPLLGVTQSSTFTYKEAIPVTVRDEHQPDHVRLQRDAIPHVYAFTKSSLEPHLMSMTGPTREETVAVCRAGAGGKTFKSLSISEAEAMIRDGSGEPVYNNEGKLLHVAQRAEPLH